MSHFDVRSAVRPDPDQPMVDIADYVIDYRIDSQEAYDTARYMLLDSLACAMLAMKFPDCVKHLGPLVPGAILPGGALVPGTRFELDPAQAAFNIGTQVRWLDFNDTWLAAEWGHPSDNLGAILAVAQHRDLRVRDVLDAAVVAHEIQGVLALETSFNRIGLDHVLLVRVASTAAAGRLLGLDEDRIAAALSHAWIDGGALRTYRHAPNTGPRKSWAAGDATARGVFLALLAARREPGYATALSAPTWGFEDVHTPVGLARPLGSYVMDNVLFKVSYPAEFHAQTAAECGVLLHPQVRDRIDEIERIEIDTQESAVRIIDKVGPLHNPADRDHCLQYVTVVALLHGALTDEHYEDEAAADPRIDALRARCVVREEPRYSREYLDPDRRSIANAVRVVFSDGSVTERVEVEYPLGHPRRRDEAAGPLRAKLEANVGPDRAALLADDPALPELGARELVASLQP